MERYNPDRSRTIALPLEEQAVPSAPDRFHLPVATPLDGSASLQPPPPDGETETATEAPPNASVPLALEAAITTRIRTVFDAHLHRLERLRASLKAPPLSDEAIAERNSRPPRWPQQQAQGTLPSYLLRETLIYLHRLEHPPLLPPPSVQRFEAAFKRHEPAFHTVFYRKYPPLIRDDAKQEALLALFRKWRKNPAILEQSSAYVVTAAIYGVSNWRKKGMKLRGRELPLLVDNHGKVAGEPRAHEYERWTDRIDLRLDVAQAVRDVLYKYQEAPERNQIYPMVEQLRGEISFTQVRVASGLSPRKYKWRQEQVKNDLRERLADYAPTETQPGSAAHSPA